MSQIPDYFERALDQQRKQARMRWLFLTLLAIMAFALLAMFIAMNAKADACNPALQDCGGLADAAPAPVARPRRHAPVAYTYSVSPEILRQRGKIGSKCGRNIPVWECERAMARMRAEDERRGRQMRAGKKPPVREARDTYRDERGRKVIVIDDSDRRRRDRRDYERDERDGRRCKSRITVTSRPMLTKARACSEARKLWSIRAGEENGGEFNSIANARGVEANPKPFHEGAWRDVCTFSAVPCRSDRRED